MGSRGLVDEAVARLAEASLLTAVLAVRPVDRDGVDTVLVSVSPRVPAATRRLITRILDGLPYECVEVDRPARGVVHGLTGVKDSRPWRIGTQPEVAWIQDHTPGSVSITAAIPPVFEAYATVVIPTDDALRAQSESVLLQVLIVQSGIQPWWLGYLDTGVHDLVFDHAPTVTLYAGWSYVLVEAGPTQAASWREDHPWHGRLPDLMYPADRSWLVSALWDDDWRCMGGPAPLIQTVIAEPTLDSHAVSIDQDATPPGHVAH